MMKNIFKKKAKNAFSISFLKQNKYRAGQGNQTLPSSCY
jgi:hypothetical protein